MIEAAGPHCFLALASLSVRDFLAQAINDDPDPGPEPPKVLLSYWYFREGGPAFIGGCPESAVGATYDMFKTPPVLFADSGAFSAGVAGFDIKVEDYVRWLRQWMPLWQVISNLDVVNYRAKWADSAGDAAATWDNQRRLEDEFQIPVVPVFHTGEPWEYLERYCQLYPYVALGGMYGTHSIIWKWLLRCFAIAAQTGTVFHGFGMSKQQVLNDLPWFSFDNSSWASGQRFGGVPLWDGRKLSPVRVGNRQSVYAAARLLRTHGYEPEQIADREVYHQRFAVGAGARAWRRYELWLRRRHRPVELRR